MTNAEARAIARDMHWMMSRRGVYGSDKDRAIIDNVDGVWVVSIWEPEYKAMWTVWLHDSGAPKKAVRTER